MGRKAGGESQASSPVQLVQLVSLDSPGQQQHTSKPILLAAAPVLAPAPQLFLAKPAPGWWRNK